MAVVIVLRSLLPKTTCHGEVSEQRRPTQYRKRDERLLESSTSKVVLTLSSSGTTEAVHPTVTEEQKRGRAEVCRHMFEKLTEAGQIG